MKNGEILKFGQNVHPALWGQESWEISVHPAGPSVVAEGESRGRSLADVAPGFPLLVKVIDAKTRLSVQVHPNEETRKLTGGDPKTEMWAMLEDGVIYAGLKPGVGPKDVEEAVKSGRFEELLVRHDALVMIVYRDTQRAFCPFLSDNVFVQGLLHFRRQREFYRADLVIPALIIIKLLIAQNIIAKSNTLIADVYIRTGNQPLNHVLFLAAERTSGTLSAEIIGHTVTLTFPACPWAGKSRR